MLKATQKTSRAMGEQMGAASAVNAQVRHSEEPVAAELVALAYRIMAAGEKGTGMRMSARETWLLTWNNLPCTADDPLVMDDA